MPFKPDADRRHFIPRQRHRVTNWAAYDAGLRARGCPTVWFTPEAIKDVDAMNVNEALALMREGGFHGLGQAGAEC